jgi:ketopantoate reductase
MSPPRAVHGAGHAMSSTGQSLRRGTTIETDFLNGEIVLLGRLHGIPTPVNIDIQRRAKLKAT